MTSPFQMAAQEYLEAGWSPIPLPSKQKFPPPDGTTGAMGRFTTEAGLREWTKPGAKANAGKMAFKPGNIAIRLPKTVIGIDADMYDGKAGRATLAAAEKAWGELPPTWTSTSKRDGSGIRLFSVPEGMAWPESLSGFFGGGVELIRWDHRYIVAMPSIHDKTGEPYVFQTPEGDYVDDEFPAPDELTPMPEAWVEGLTQGREWHLREAEDLDADDVLAWIEARPDHEICTAMQTTLTRWSRSIREAGDDGGAHDEARDGAWALIGDAGAGHAGLGQALAKMRKTFLAAVKGRRGRTQAADEWRRIVIRGVQKVAAEGEPEPDDMCTMLSDSREAKTPAPKRKGNKGSSLYDYTRDDIGNAQRFVNDHGENIRWVEALGGWHFWNGLHWELDANGQIKRWAAKTVRDMAQEAEFIEEAKTKAAFLVFIRASSNLGRLNAMIDLAKSMSGITVPGSFFNNRKEKLLVLNGMVMLQRDGVHFRPSTREDFVNQVTAAEYHAGCWQGTRFEEFLKRTIPDEDLRHWTQKAVGYSLLGGNPKRLLFFAQGETSSGKSTFGNALRVAMGEYGATFNLTLFREDKEQGSNVQLVRLLPKRFIVCFETSSNRHLHNDQVKRMTGNDALQGRLNHANELVERKPAFTPWVVTNNAPTIEGADKALWRRLHTIPFNETIAVEEEDDSLEEWMNETPEGRSAVLSWAVDGWGMYAREGLDDVPAAAVRATMKTREELSDLDMWMAECCETGSEGEYREMSMDLYQAYKAWCEESGTKIDSLAKFGRGLAGRGHDKVRGRVGQRDDDKKAWYRVGMRLTREWAKRMGLNR